MEQSHAVVINDMKTQWDAQGRAGSEEMTAASWLLRANLLLVATYENVLGTLGLTMARWECLAVLYWSKNGALGLTKMSERLAVHPTTITYAVDQLEKAGLVERVPHPHDRRQILAALTPKGRKLTERGLDLLEKERFGLGRVSQTDLLSATRLLRKFVSQLTPDDSPSARSTNSVATQPDDSTVTRGRPRRGGGVRQRRA